VSREQDLLRDIQAVLASAEVDVSELIEGAWADAQQEVRATLRRLMSRDLLGRALAGLGGDEGTSTAPSAPAPEVDERSEGPRGHAASATLASTPAPEPEPPVVAPEPEPPVVPAAPPGATATYVFGIVGPHAELPRRGLPRLPGGTPPRLLAVEGAQALVCDVDPATFESLREPGPDGLELLAAAAHTHDAVLARFVDATVLPLPLGTVFTDDGTVTRLLDRHAAQLRAELERLTGTSEWAVTVRTVEDAPHDEAAGPPASGRDYLEARRAARRQREERWAEQERLVDDLHGPLTACAVDAQQIASRPLEEATPPLLHGVYLVADDARDRFASTVAYLRAEHPGTIVEVTGPWPPYHFAALDLTNDSEPAT
jgi:hypothetical protein